MRKSAVRFLSSLSILLLPFATFPLHAASYSSTLGVMKVNLTGGQTNLISTPFVPSALIRAAVDSVSGLDVTLDVASLPDVDGDHYLEIMSGASAGLVADIDAQAGSTVTLSDDLSGGLGEGILIAIRETPTINSVFGADNRFGFKGNPDGQPVNVDIIWYLNPENRVPVAIFYDSGVGFEGWYTVSGYTPAGGFKIYPETAMWSVMNGPSVEVTFLGEVREAPPTAGVFPGVNFISVGNPISGLGVAAANRELTLGNSNLYTGNVATGVRSSSTGFGDDADLVVVVNPSSPTPVRTFFYDVSVAPEAWIDASGFSIEDDFVLKSGLGVYVIRREAADPAFNWSQPVNYLP